MADMEVIDLLSMKNPVFCTFILWSSLLVLKMLGMSLLTAFNRFRYKTTPNEEDTQFMGKVVMEQKFDEPHVERVRRAHRNDMENILPYFSVGLFFIATDPNAIFATVLFRLASIARVVHTLVYAFYPVPQPSRVLAWLVHYAITGIMGFYVLFVTLKYI